MGETRSGDEQGSGDVGDHSDGGEASEEADHGRPFQVAGRVVRPLIS